MKGTAGRALLTILNAWFLSRDQGSGPIPSIIRLHIDAFGLRWFYCLNLCVKPINSGARGERSGDLASVIPDLNYPGDNFI